MWPRRGLISEILNVSNFFMRPNGVISSSYDQRNPICNFLSNLKLKRKATDSACLLVGMKIYFDKHIREKHNYIKMWKELFWLLKLIVINFVQSSGNSHEKSLYFMTSLVSKGKSLYVVDGARTFFEIKEKKQNPHVGEVIVLSPRYYHCYEL